MYHTVAENHKSFLLVIYTGKGFERGLFRQRLWKESKGREKIRDRNSYRLAIKIINSLCSKHRLEISFPWLHLRSIMLEANYKQN